MFEPFSSLLCFLFFLFIFLVFVALIGHGLWVFAASVFGARDRSARHTEERRERRRACVGCGFSFYEDDGLCPECGLDPKGKVARELRDLEIAARTVQHLTDLRKLAPESSAEVRRSIGDRQNELLPEQSRLTPVQQIEAWFGDDLGERMKIEERKKALALARTMRPADLRALSARALVGLARLLNSVGLLTRACQAYRVLYDCHPDAPICKSEASAALRTARQANDRTLADDLMDLVGPAKPRVEPVVSLPAPSVAAIAGPKELAPDAPPLAAVVENVPLAIEPQPAASLTPPRRSMAEWVAVFMEERNILWGELIGGTLIVGCSIALVISLWHTLEQIHYFPFLILAAITSALFSAGFYTLHHWKLESTSRGLLLIGMLLVPLDFMVFAGLTRTEGTGLFNCLIGGAAALGFGFLLQRASRILIETPLDVRAPSAWLVTLALLGCAGAQWLASTLIGEGIRNELAVYLLSLSSAFAPLLCIGWILMRLAAVSSWRLNQVVGLLIALGATSFAASVMLTPIYVENLERALVLLSPAVTLLGVPLLLTGTLMHRRLERENIEQFALWRTLGTGIGLLGVFVMFGGFATAAPSLTHRWLSGLTNTVTLLATAWWLRVPMLHVPVQAYLAILLALGGRLDLDATVIAEPDVALRLSGLFVLQMITAETLLRCGRRLDARFYAVGAGVSTVLALVLILRIAGDHPGAAALVCGTAALTWYVANVRWRLAELTYACSLVLAGAIFFALRHGTELPVVEGILWTLLAHATICLAANVTLRRVDLDWVRDRFRIPFGVVSLTASICAATFLTFKQFDFSLSPGVSSVACLWLAALWLTSAVLEGWPILFGAFQVALSFAWLFGAADWQTRHDWVWWEPFSLQVYALGLVVLSLAWEVTRLLLRAKPWKLLSPTFVPVDRLVAGMLVIVQYALAGLLVLWSVGLELSHSPDTWRVFPVAWQREGYSICAWLVPIVLAAIMLLWLREVDWRLPVLGLTLLSLTFPLLAAGTWFHDTKAAASALRWGLAACYLLVSALLWWRHRLGQERAAALPLRSVRGLLLGTAVLPVLLITLYVVVVKLGDGDLPGPENGMFSAMGGSASLLVPLGMLCAALAGHGFRERLDYYLGGAGALINACCVGAFFLALHEAHEPFDQVWIAVDALLLGAAVAWVWSMTWAAISGALEAGENRPLLDSPLLTLNSFLGTTLFGCVLLTALSAVIFGGDDANMKWVVEAGSIRGWVVFALVGSGAIWLFWRRHASLPLHVFGSVGLAAVGMSACAFAAVSPEHAFIALMFGSGAFACVWAWATLLIDPTTTPRWLSCTAERLESAFTVTAAVLALLLGGRALFVAEHRLWSAEAIGLSSAAFALLAYQHKQEIWASVASLALTPASTILVLHFDPDNPHLMLCVVQTALATLGVTSLLRLSLERWIHPEEGVQLNMQIGGGLFANGLLALAAFVALLIEPREPNVLLGLRGARNEFLLVSGWLALLSNGAAALWQVSRVRPRLLVHVAGAVGWLIGIGLAVSVDLLVEQDWLAHHVLTLSWTLHAMLLLAFSWLSHVCTAVGPGFWIEARRTHTADWLRGCLPEAATRLWVVLSGALVVCFALRAASLEPEHVAWPIANIVAVSVLMGATAVWTRRSGYVFASGLLLNVVGALVWVAHRAELPADQELSAFVFAQVLSFGIASIIWSLLERLFPHSGEEAALFPFTQAALHAGLHLVAVVIAFATVLHLTGHAAPINGILAWLSVGGVALAAIIDGARPSYRGWLRYPLYLCGLCTLGLMLHGWDLAPADWFRLAMLLLAAYVLLIVLIARCIDSLPSLQAWLKAATQHSEWFWNVQLLSMGLVVVVSLWATLTHEVWTQRLCGAVAVTLCTFAALLLVARWPQMYPREIGVGHRLFSHYLVLTLALITALEASWGLLDLDLPALWLQRTSAAFTLMVAALLLCRFAGPRWLAGGPWGEACAGHGAVLGVGAILLLVVFLGEQFVSYGPQGNISRTPQLLVLAIPSSLAILGLTGLALWSALTKRDDPYGIEGDRRSIYVYATELLALALIIHLRLNVPRILPHLLGQFWYLSVLALAFVVTALGDTFARRGLSVLAEPLKRSAFVLAFVPVLAFRFAAVAVVPPALVEAVPGLQPLKDYLQGMGLHFQMEALCWLLLGIFFGWQAGTRGSANLGIAGLLAVNFGFWVLLGHGDTTDFLRRPQLWLIPLGLIVLLAEHINRERLGFWPSLSVRYAGLACIYLSSTIEMFMEHLSPLFAVVLAVVAVTGMLLGILLRVRAFLLAGFLALLVVVFAQIWHAAVVREHNWVWWASGIVLGILILALFAIFEKHKNEVLKALDSMKRWS